MARLASIIQSIIGMIGAGKHTTQCQYDKRNVPHHRGNLQDISVTKSAKSRADLFGIPDYE